MLASRSEATVTSLALYIAFIYGSTDVKSCLGIVRERAEQSEEVTMKSLFSPTVIFKPFRRPSGLASKLELVLRIFL